MNLLNKFMSSFIAKFMNKILKLVFYHYLKVYETQQKFKQYFYDEC